MNPFDLLPDYVLGLLTESEKLEVEKYLASSGAARAELIKLQKTLVSLSEAMPEQTPKTTFKDIQNRLKQPVSAPAKPRYTIWTRQLREWRNYALAASITLAFIGFSWALQLQKQLQQTQAEQRKVNYWLAHDNVKTVVLNPVDNNPDIRNFGSVVLLEDGRCLFMLYNDPPAGKSYQVWGQGYNDPVSLAVSQSKFIEVNYTEYKVLGVSLEPYGGSPEPTQPLSRISTY
jgi:anti-sigma-K factor RskA